jgi:alkylhydroperoxidase family enzyme
MRRRSCRRSTIGIAACVLQHWLRLVRLDKLDEATIERVIACMQTDDDDGVRRAAAAIAKRMAAREPYAAAALARVAAEEEKP